MNHTSLGVIYITHTKVILCFHYNLIASKVLCVSPWSSSSLKEKEKSF